MERSGKISMGRRECTSNYKIKPIHREARRIAGRADGVKNGPTIEQWIGISTDEAHRMKPETAVSYISNRWPLIEAGMSRTDCMDWFKENYPGQPLQKSSCIGCPYHAEREWGDLAESDPEGMAKAIALDEAIRQKDMYRDGRLHFLHRSCRPLETVIARIAAKRAAGQQLSMLDDGAGNECSGICFS